MNWPACYEIRVAEPVERHWLMWFLDLGITPSGDQKGPGTLLRGDLRDPAALFGLLARIRDLNLTLLEVRRIEETE
jgi:hypothetical protein